jgi:carboxymethylenebutenolidase
MTVIGYPAPAGPLPGYLAEPDGAGPWPGVVVVHDVVGLGRDTKRITDRFAQAGYLALAPALFRRGLRPRCVVATLRAQARGRGTAVDDLVAARDFLAADPRCTGRVGSVGFCLGGGFCLVLAPRGVFDATAPNYAPWPDDVSELPRSCPTVASYGGRDPMLRGAAARLEQMLTDGHVPHDVKEYPRVGHSFMNDWQLPNPVLRMIERTPGIAYAAPEAEDAWRRILAFFGEHLGGRAV